MLGGLLALIALFSSCSHVHISVLGSIALDQQVGVLLITALLPALNWRLVVAYELREIEFERSEREYEQRKSAHEHRMQQLESEIARLNALNSKIDALLFNSSTSSIPPQSMPGSSEG